MSHTHCLDRWCLHPEHTAKTEAAARLRYAVPRLHALALKVAAMYADTPIGAEARAILKSIEGRE